MNKKSSPTDQVTPHQTEDRLVNWTRPTREECPICMLPLPLCPKESMVQVCCGNNICLGCVHTQILMDIQEDTQRTMICPFCREEERKGQNNFKEKKMQLAKAGNDLALFEVASCYFDGIEGFEQDKTEAVKWYQRAVEAGNAKAAMDLASCYQMGDGVKKNDAMRLFYLKKACELGSEPVAFCKLGTYLMGKGEMVEGMLNFRKAAFCGMEDDKLSQTLRLGFQLGHITKDEYASTLRENQAAAAEYKSAAREIAKTLLGMRPSL